MLSITIRVLAVIMLAVASLQLALLIANAVFLSRQGQGNADDLPMMFIWVVVIIVALGLYAREGPIGDRVMAVIQQRRGVS